MSINFRLAIAGAAGLAMLAIIGKLSVHIVSDHSDPMPDPALAVASIKTSRGTDFRREEIKFLPGGRMVATNYPLQVLIAGAYHHPYQICDTKGMPVVARNLLCKIT